MPGPPEASQIEIAILTILPASELNAALRLFGVSDAQRMSQLIGKMRCWLTTLRTNRNILQSVVIADIGPAGNVRSGSSTAALLSRFKPNIVCICGIAAGRRRRVKLGDVVVADSVLAYEGAKQLKSRISLRPERRTIQEHTRGQIRHFEANANRLNWRRLYRHALADIPETDLPPAAQLPWTPSLHYPAVIASGEKVIGDGSLPKLADRFGEDRMVALDMESFGLALAAEQAETQWLVFRGISDFGDPVSKDGQFKDRFHLLASISAASCLLAFLQSEYIPRKVTGVVPPAAAQATSQTALVPTASVEPTNASVVQQVLEAGITRFIRSRRHYALARPGAPTMELYVARALATVTVVSINLMTGEAFHGLSEVLESKLEDRSKVRFEATISLLNPRRKDLMTAVSASVGIDELSRSITRTLDKFAEFRAKLSRSAQQRLQIRVHNVIPFASGILLDSEDDREGRIQIETKPYKAAIDNSFAIEFASVGADSIFHVLRKAYKRIIDEGAEWRP